MVCTDLIIFVYTIISIIEIRTIYIWGLIFNKIRTVFDYLYELWVFFIITWLQVSFCAINHDTITLLGIVFSISKIYHNLLVLKFIWRNAPSCSQFSHQFFFFNLFAWWSRRYENVITLIDMHTYYKRKWPIKPVAV